MEKLINIIKNNLYVFSLYARQISGALVLFVIARYLSVHDYGLFSSYKSIVLFCFMFANMEYANYILVSSKANVHEVKAKSSLFIINAIAICLFIIFCSCFCKLENHLIFILVVLRSFFDAVFFGLVLPYFQASKKFNIIAIINIIYAFCVAIIAIVSYILKLSLIKFLFISIILGLINFIQCSYYIKLTYFSVFKKLKSYIKMIDKSILCYMGSTITDYVYTQTSALYVAIFLPKEDAALYFAAFNVAIIVSLLSSAQTQKLLPELVKANLSHTKQLLKSNLVKIWLLLIIFLLGIACFGKIIMRVLYGQNYYEAAYPILLIYFISNMLIAHGAILGTYLTAIKKQSLKAFMKVEASIVIILSLFALHSFGVFGAVLSLLIASLYISVRYTICTLTFLKKNLSGREV